jgi:uncharacterized LabA/DUF88 family protein
MSGTVAANSGCVILVDNSNVFIEGQKFSARRKGLQRGPTDRRDPQDPSWRIDFGALLQFMAEGRTIIAAILVGSEPPQNDTVWNAARQHNFEVLTYTRGFKGEEKEVDTEIVARGTEIVCDHPSKGVIVLASGDRDFLPLVRVAHRRGWPVEMCAFSNAFNPSGGMALTVDRVRQLDSAFDKIGRHDFIWP